MDAFYCVHKTVTKAPFYLSSVASVFTTLSSRFSLVMRTTSRWSNWKQETSDPNRKCSPLTWSRDLRLLYKLVLWKVLQDLLGDLPRGDLLPSGLQHLHTHTDTHTHTQ